MALYTKKLKIEICKKSNLTPQHTIITGVLYVLTDFEINIDFRIERNPYQGWILKVYNFKNREWRQSVLFPEQMKETAWQDGCIMSWITRNIEKLLFLSGRDRNIILK